jgi:hypothetical protein
MKKLFFLLSFVLTIVGFSLNANAQQTLWDPCIRTICGNFISSQGGCIECGPQDLNCYTIYICGTADRTAVNDPKVEPSNLYPKILKVTTDDKTGKQITTYDVRHIPPALIKIHRN